MPDIHTAMLASMPGRWPGMEADLTSLGAVTAKSLSLLTPKGREQPYYYPTLITIPTGAINVIKSNAPEASV